MLITVSLLTASLEFSSTAPESSEQTPKQQEVSKLSTFEELEATTTSQDKLIVDGSQNDNRKQMIEEHASCKENKAAVVESYPNNGTLQYPETLPNVCSGTKETDTFSKVVISHAIVSCMLIGNSKFYIL